jgi:hypothetical protein
MHDIRIPDMYSHFIYEEFHPNDKDDVELWTGEFLDSFFTEGTEGLFIPIGDKELYDTDGNPISQNEFRKKIDEFHALDPVITECNYEIHSLHIAGDYAIVEVETSWVGLNQFEQAMTRHEAYPRCGSNVASTSGGILSKQELWDGIKLCKKNKRLQLLFSPPVRPHRESDRPKRQSSHRSAPGEEVQEEGRFQHLDNHEKRQDNTKEHQNQAENKKEAWGVHKIISSR